MICGCNFVEQEIKTSLIINSTLIPNCSKMLHVIPEKLKDKTKEHDPTHMYVNRFCRVSTNALGNTLPTNHPTEYLHVCIGPRTNSEQFIYEGWLLPNVLSENFVFKINERLHSHQIFHVLHKSIKLMLLSLYQLRSNGRN